MLIENLLGFKKEVFGSTALYDDLISSVSSQANSGQAVVNVASGTNFAVGECVVIFDPVTNNFETATIQSKNVNALTMSANLTNTYGAGSHIGKYIGYLDTVSRKYKRKYAPDLGTGADGAFVSSGNATWSTNKNFTSITIQNGHTITIQGDVVVRCTGAVDIQAGGKISAKGQGGAGGAGASNDNGAAQAGASYTGVQPYQTGANGGGGGGGDTVSSVNYSGGGGGGYGVAGGNGTGGSNVGGGGGTYNDAELSNQTYAYLIGSGGGGASGSYNTQKGSGGSGGGAIRIFCMSLSCAGEIDCDGNQGSNQNSSAGGGGSGGTIYIVAMASIVLGTGLIHASGATAVGNGGAGGAGRIRIEAPSITGTTTPTYGTGYASGLTAYTKYGFYFTQKITMPYPVISVNTYIKQVVVVNELIGASVSAGQKNCQVADGAKYAVGDKVIVKEGSKFEVHTIASKNVNVLTMVDNFANAFTTSGRVFRIDAIGYCSLKPAGVNEAQVVMTLKEVFFENSDTIIKLVYSKTIKSNNSGSEAMELVGMVMIKDVALNTREVAIKEVNWEYF